MKKNAVKITEQESNIPDDLKDTCTKIIKVCMTKQTKENWSWRTVFTTAHSKVNVDEDYSKEDIFKQLDKQFASVRKFENQLKEKLMRV